MLKKKIFLISLSFILIGCAASTPESTNEVTVQKQNSNYELRIIEDPSTGILTAFYEKDGNLYYRQISQPYSDGDNITLQMKDGQRWNLQRTLNSKHMNNPSDDVEFLKH